jgi:beta-glucosidase
MKYNQTGLHKKAGVRLRLNILLKAIIAGLLIHTLVSPFVGRATDVQFASGSDEAVFVPGSPPIPNESSLRGAKYLDSQIPLEERVEDLFSRLLPEEKVALLRGDGGMGYGKIARIGLPEILMTDGPQGVRLDAGNATAFPCALAMASAWNPSLLELAGVAMGEECRALNRRVFLAVGVNIMRTPLGGRNFEYMGEDPYLAGKTAAAFVRGIQSQGIAACIKHWNLNEQEHWRTTINVECDERALHEIYCPAFEMGVKEGGVWSVMPAYNRFRGDYCTASKHLNIDILENEYGFDGALISDWNAWHDDKLAIEGGCTIEMPSKPDAVRDARLVARIANGEISQSAFDEAVRRNLRLLFRIGAFDAYQGGSVNTTEHQQVSRQMATESIVLLKNNGNLLPLDINKLKRIAVIGPNADQYHTMADGSPLSARGGSGATRPPYEITPLAALKARFGDKILYVPGMSFGQRPASTNLVDEAVAAAKAADVVLFFAGLDHSLDCEFLGWEDKPGADKPSLELIGPQAELIQKIVAVNSNAIVVLVNGSPVSVEQWHQSVPAIIESWYGGMESGNAVADILSGYANPSGKLPCTFGKKLDDWLCHKLGPESFPGSGNNGVVRYLDGIWVGYRHFDQANIEPRFPFGHGLSYTTFKYGKPVVLNKSISGSQSSTISIPITNTGARAGAEVVQLYIHEVSPTLPRPPQELKGFAKLTLQPGETKNANFSICQRDLAYWDEASRNWKATPGKFEVRIGSSSRDIRAVAKIDLTVGLTAK